MCVDKFTRTAIKRAGGSTLVARHLGITKGAIYLWEQIPPKHVWGISKLSGIPCHELRPDIFPAPEVADESAA